MVPKFREPRDGIVVGTIEGVVVATEKMKCDHCVACLLNPATGRCIYGGPFKFVKSEG